MEVYCSMGGPTTRDKPRPVQGETLSRLCTLAFSLLAVIIGFAYLQYRSSATLDALDVVVTALVVLCMSVIAGYVSRDPFTSFETAALSGFSLLLAGQILIFRYSGGTNVAPTAETQVVPGLSLGLIVFISLFLSVLGSILVASLSSSLFTKGPLVGRLKTFWSPVVDYMNRNSGLMTIIALIVSCFVALLVAIWRYGGR
jgi:hypothetical protein